MSPWNKSFRLKVSNDPVFQEKIKEKSIQNFPDSRDLSCDPWREPDPYICNLDSTTKLE